MDYEQVRTIIRQEVERGLTLERNEFGGSFRQGIEDKSRDALVENAVLREATVYSSPGLYARIRDTVYEVLKQNGVIQ